MGFTSTGEVSGTHTITATVEPGKTLTFTATVKVKNQDGDPPSVPVPVAVEVEVEPFSGGHDHNDSTRPKGSVSPASGNTSFQIEFTSTEVSGTHIITATYDLCENKTEIAMVDVMVPGLETIPASTFYTMFESTGDVIGARTGWHTDNHNLTPAAAAMLWQLAVPYQVEQRFKLRDPATGKFTIPPPVMRKMLAKEHRDLDRDDGDDDGDKERKAATLPGIDRLAARVLNFDLRYALERAHKGKDKD